MAKATLYKFRLYIINLNLDEPYLGYCKVASSDTSHLEAHAGIFRLLMKEIFDPYLL